MLRDKKMANFERRQFEIGLEFVCRSSAERNIFSKGSSERTKDAQVIQVRGAAAPRVFELKLLVFLVVPIQFAVSGICSRVTLVISECQFRFSVVSFWGSLNVG